MSKKTSTTFNIDIVKLLRPNRRVTIDDVIKKEFADLQKLLGKLEKKASYLQAKLELLKDDDKLDNFAIQDLMSELNQAEQLASSLAKKRDCLGSSIINKI